MDIATGSLENVDDKAEQKFKTSLVFFSMKMQYFLSVGVETVHWQRKVPFQTTYTHAKLARFIRTTRSWRKTTTAQIGQELSEEFDIFPKLPDRPLDQMHAMHQDKNQLSFVPASDAKFWLSFLGNCSAIRWTFLAFLMQRV